MSKIPPYIDYISKTSALNIASQAFKVPGVGQWVLVVTGDAFRAILATRLRLQSLGLPFTKSHQPVVFCTTWAGRSSSHRMGPPSIAFSCLRKVAKNGRYNELVTGGYFMVYKPTTISGGPHLVVILFINYTIPNSNTIDIS